ncbi:MAG: hypothetical protein U0324_36815 [Polyangiales bacterium]
MAALTLTEFIEHLIAIGYRPPTPEALYPPCEHGDATWTLLQIPSPSFVAPPTPYTWGAMGWWRQEGCETCVLEFHEALWCGDACRCVRVYRGEEDVGAELGFDEMPLLPPETPLPGTPPDQG